jgi:hypothetical protein
MAKCCWLAALSLLMLLVAAFGEDGNHVVSLGPAEKQVAPKGVTGIDQVRQLLQRVGKGAEVHRRLVSLGESLAAAQSNLPQIHAFADKLMKGFMSDATGASATQSRTSAQFDALVASIARQLQNGDSNKVAMLSNLVKEAVQAEVLRKGGRSGEVEDMEIPTDDKDEDPEAGSKMEQDAADKVDQQVSGEMSRRQRLRSAARTLEIQKAKDRESEAQAKVDQLTKEEEDQKQKVAQFTIEEEKLREEASKAHSAAKSRDIASKIAREETNTAMKLAKQVAEEEQRVNQIKVEARDSLMATLQKDHDAKQAQQSMLTAEEALETVKESKIALDRAADATMDKIHKKLAKEIKKVEEANEEKETAARKLKRAEAMVADATDPDEKAEADTRLAAAEAKMGQTKAQAEMDTKAQKTATTLAGTKKKTQALQVAATEAHLKSADLNSNNMKLASEKADKDAEEAQQHASKMSIESTAEMGKLRELREQAQEAAQKSMEAKRMESPTVANEVATKKAIAVASTNFVKRQAAAKVLMIQKKKKAALEELSVIRVVAARLAAESPANQEGDETQEAEEAPDKVEPIGSPDQTH